MDFRYAGAALSWHLAAYRRGRLHCADGGDRRRCHHRSGREYLVRRGAARRYRPHSHRPTHQRAGRLRAAHRRGRSGHRRRGLYAGPRRDCAWRDDWRRHAGGDARHGAQSGGGGRRWLPDRRRHAGTGGQAFCRRPAGDGRAGQSDTRGDGGRAGAHPRWRRPLSQLRPRVCRRACGRSPTHSDDKER